MEKRLKLALPGAVRECQTTSDALCLYFVRLEKSKNITVFLQFGALHRFNLQHFRFSYF